MCCGLTSCLTCCGLFSPLKKCCCIIPLRCGVLLFAIIFIMIDGIILIAYAERMTFIQRMKDETISRSMQVKEKLETLANPRFLKGADPAMSEAVNKVSGGTKGFMDAVKHLGNLKRVKKSNLLEWKSDRMSRFLDMFGFDKSPNGVSFSSWEPWRRVYGPKKVLAVTPSPEKCSVKASWMNGGRGIFWSEEALKDETQDLPGTKTFKILFAVEIENIVFAVVWWIMGWYLLICAACNLRCCACVWVVAMIVRCVEIVIHVFIIAYTCWCLKHCGKVAFPNILSLVILVILPYAILVVISWILSK